MFLEFYGLKEQPFGVTPDPHFICPSRTHSKAFNSLSRGLEAGCGFLALIAKPGMGKTTLVFHLLKQLEQTSRTVFLFQTQCDSRELLRYLLSGLGLDAAGQDIVGMHERLNQVLAREVLAGRRFVLVIDECQNLDNSVLETVRLLSDFETPKTKLIQIVLVGQTQLAEKLSSPSLAQLRQRISMLCRLEPLTRAEVLEYIEHRLRVAGYAGTPLFTAEALERIFVWSEGIPRNVNNVCFNTLLAGCVAGRRQIDSAIVDRVLTELDMKALNPTPSAAQEEPPAPPRRASAPDPGVFKGDLDRTPADSDDAGKGVVAFEAAPAELGLQGVRPQPLPPAPRSPLSSARVRCGDLSDGKQLDLRSGNLRRTSTENADLPQSLSASAVPRLSYVEDAGSERRFTNEVSLFADILECVRQTGDRAVQVPKAISNSDPNPRLPKPHVAQALALAVLRHRGQSQRVAARPDSSVIKQVASTSVDRIFGNLARFYAPQKKAQAGRMTSFAPQPTVLSYPVASRRSLRRRVAATVALGAVLALVGLLTFDSKVRANRQLQDPAAGVAPAAMPLSAAQDSRAPRPQPQSPRGRTPRRPLVQSFLTHSLGLKVGRIVIDPGHGGHDTGATGPMGLTEKDLCLDVALRLGRIMEQRLPGAEVIFTRTDDTFIPLKERTDLANERKADLFLSIHANSSQNHEDRGVETYYLNLRADPGALEVAARENATAQETEGDLQDLVEKIARNEKIEESRKFAEDIQDSLSRHIQSTAKTVKSRGLRRAPFMVLVGANMPSVLAEISFLSNPSDEQLLKKDEYRQGLAEGLYQGVESYLQSLNSVTYGLPARDSAPIAGRSRLGLFSGGLAAVEQSRNQH